ncbi:MAG: FG-GAP repeat protein [Trueperaceae bacterium]
MPEHHDFLGSNVAMSGAALTDLTIVAGTSNEEVVVFAHDGAKIAEQQRLVASDATGNEDFGSAVDIDGNIIIVGANNAADASGTLDAAGAAYVFVRSGTTWLEVDKLYAPTPQLFARFGMSVAVDGEYAIVGENIVYPGDEPIANAYVFRYTPSGWEHTTTLDSTDPDEGSRFGRAVALDAGHAVVSDLNAKSGAEAVGAVYVYGR